MSCLYTLVVFHAENQPHKQYIRFLPTHKPTLKNQKSYFLPLRSNDIEKKELNLKTERYNTLYGNKNLETTKGNK
jgi:hypothetical protein